MLARAIALPADRALQVFLIHLDDPALAAVPSQSAALLDDAERRLLAARAQATAGRRFLVGRWLVRHALAATLGIGVHAVRLETGPEGKAQAPLAKAAGLAFNLAHSGPWLALALARAAAVGVDLERLEHGPRALRVATTVFPAAEVAQLMQRPAAERAELALRYWTIKESVVKALGTTVWAGLRGVRLTGAGARLDLSALPADTPPPDRWQVAAGRLGPALYLAVAAVGTTTPFPATARTLPFDHDLPWQAAPIRPRDPNIVGAVAAGNRADLVPPAG